jgi:hypothetical protein
MPPVLAHLVERQHVDSLDVAETGGELRDVRDPAKIIGQSRTSASGVSLWVDHVQLLLRVEHFSDRPRACLSVPSAAGMDEFASIGSNDMTSLAVEPTNACPRGHPRSHSRLCTVAAPCCSKAERPAQAAAEVVIDNPARYVARKAQVRTRSLYECENHHRHRQARPLLHLPSTMFLHRRRLCSMRRRWPPAFSIRSDCRQAVCCRRCRRGQGPGAASGLEAVAVSARDVVQDSAPDRWYWRWHLPPRRRCIRTSPDQRGQT